MYYPTIEFFGLVLLAGMNIVLGIWILIFSFRLLTLNRRISRAISELESRISRLEVITNLSETRQPKKT
ncbi:MAG: hypothetical protein DMG06_22790 [Acidobacteria bacterium]|nr:MAG: hypothetical protein DMG06_22790 [Acidobacteriota bacterium]